MRAVGLCWCCKDVEKVRVNVCQLLVVLNNVGNDITTTTVLPGGACTHYTLQRACRRVPRVHSTTPS